MKKGRKPKLHYCNGEAKTKKEWAEHLRIKYHTLASYLCRGYSLEDLVERVNQ